MTELTRQFAAVAFVLALLGAALWILRRYGAASRPWRARANAVLEVVEHVSLGPAHRLHLVRVAGRAVLIATHASGSTLIDTLPWSEAGAASFKEQA
jgi:flagellar biosynthetic protein FliO